MSRSREWTMIFVCREKGHNQEAAKRAINYFVETGSRYNYVCTTSHGVLVCSGEYNYRVNPGDRTYRISDEHEAGDPDGSKLIRAMEIATREPGGGILLDFPTRLGVPWESDYDNWTFLRIQFRPGWDQTLDYLKIENFLFAADLYNYFLAETPMEVEKEKWGSDAKIKLPRLVEVCKHVYSRLHPYYATIVPDLTGHVDHGLPNLAPFNLFSPELIAKVGREMITACPWWKCEELEDGSLECWFEEDFLYYPVYSMKEHDERFLRLNKIPLYEIAGNL